MKTKQHYDHHLCHFYSWMMGNFHQRKNEFLKFCKTQNIIPNHTTQALDLGAGNGIQSIALAELGFNVTAIDFNQPLLNELNAVKKELPVETVYDDLRNISMYQDKNPELIICCGDTLAHLESEQEISELIQGIYHSLIPQGQTILTFRDYSSELTGEKRFIPVKSDENRILTCILEYSENKVNVTDLLHEKTGDQWVQKASSYEKVRTSGKMIRTMLKLTGFNMVFDEMNLGMITIVSAKA